MTKEYMKQILVGKKKLFKREIVRFVTVHKFDEISVKHLYDKMLERKEMKPYFPDTYAKGRQCDKSYFFNVAATIFPGEISNLIVHANNQRFEKSGDDEEKENLFINDEWVQLLQ